MKLILPFPPSVNTYWRHPNKGAFAGKSLISAAGRKFQSAACAAIVEQLRRLPKPTSAPASVEIVLFPPDTRLPAPTTSAVMQNAAVGQSTTPAQSTGWPSVTHPALNNAPAVKNTVDLPTWEELTDIRDTLNTAIDKELSRTTSDVLFLALRRVKADLNADINTRLEQSARIIQRTPDEVLPALVLAATWFDNAARDADIIRRNAITHPGFVPVIPLKVPVQ